MGRSGEPNPSRGFWKLIFPAVALLCTLPLFAQKSQDTSPPKYDVHTETKMKVTVEEMKLPPKGSEKEAAHLLVKTGADTSDVYLCPKSFLDDMGVPNFNQNLVVRHRTSFRPGQSAPRLPLHLAEAFIRVPGTFKELAKHGLFALIERAV
jgi:hypothetical protein